MFELTGKRVVLTGGTGLIGRELLRSLPALGARLMVGTRRVRQAETRLSEFDYGNDAPKPLFGRLDLADANSIRQFFQYTQEHLDGLDVLINNAWPRTEDWQSPMEMVTAESLYQNLCDHAGGYFLCCQEAAVMMKGSGGGAILNMGSIYGEVAPNFSVYEGTGMTTAAAYPLIKGGIHTLTKYLASYLAADGIRVNCVSPGGIEDRSHQHPQFVKNYERLTPLGRMGRPDDIVGPVVFMISDAARYVTGQILFVDGGWTCR